MDDARRLDPDFDLTRSWDLPTPPDQAVDVSFESYLRSIGFNDAQLHYTRRSWGNAACEDISRISAQATYEDLTDDSAGSGDTRILDGYDRLHTYLASGLNIVLGAVVQSIEWMTTPIRVTLSDGAVHEGDRMIVTLPLGVLQSGRVRFIPELPERKQAAIDGLIMGPALKMVYVFDGSVLPDGVMALYSAENPTMWWSPTFGHGGRLHALTAFVTGDYARELTAMGEEKALAYGLRTFQEQLGQAVPEPIRSCFVNWTADPFAGGGYSVAPVGGRHARAALAEPIDDRLFWAGEATAPNPWAATVHGAYASGRRAAAEVIHSVAANTTDVSSIAANRDSTVEKAGVKT